MSSTLRIFASSTTMVARCKSFVWPALICLLLVNRDVLCESSEGTSESSQESDSWSENSWSSYSSWWWTESSQGSDSRSENSWSSSWWAESLYSSWFESSNNDDCWSYPCNNDGECQPLTSTEGWECVCQVGWTGDVCDIPECEPSPCLNGGVCSLDYYGHAYECECEPGFFGTNCEIGGDFCESYPCYNGASCISDGWCQCQSGYTGIQCETAITDSHPCAFDPCFNDGSCISVAASSSQFQCICSAAFTGDHCETELSDPCEPDPCDRGWCYHDPDVATRFGCDCEYGYNGTLCEYDVLKPEIYCSAGKSIQLEANQDSQAVYWDTPETWDNSEGDVRLECEPPSGTTFTEGETKVWCYASDSSDNTNSCYFYITLTRLEVPEIYCIGDITQPALPDKGYATVEYPAPSVFNANSYNCWPASGGIFDIGDTAVTCQAWRSSVSARCIFNINVRDLQKPVITCPENVRKSTAYQAQYNQVWWRNPAVSDNSGQAEQWCEPASGEVFWLGDHVVICYAMDFHNNQQSCSFEVEIFDDEPPSISCPGSKIQPTDWGRNTAEVWFGDLQTWDNSNDYVNVECEPREGYFPIGNTEVQCIATDESGNERDCSFDVVIYDNEPPSIVCPLDIYKKRDPGADGIAVDWTVRAYDNTGVDPETTCRPAQGYEFLYGRTTVTCVAEDASNNRETCQFTVEVTDYDVPTIFCPADIQAETLPGVDYSSVKYEMPTYLSTSAQEIDVSCNYDIGSEFSIGSHTIECVATNTDGFSSGCVFLVEVVDNEDPTIQCPSNRIILSPDGESVIPEYTDVPSYDDNSGEAYLSCNPHLDTAFEVGGPYEITCYVIDESQNDAECTFIIRVVESVPADPCALDFDQCNSNGDCITIDADLKDYRCECYDGWTGQFCDDEDHCSGANCGENGNCINLDNYYECECYDGWSGDSCDVPPEDDGGSSGGDPTGGDNGTGDKGGNDTQTGNAAAIIGAASGGAVVLIIIVVAVIACVLLLRNRSSAKRPRGLSTQPLALQPNVHSSRPSTASPPNGKTGFDNSAYNSTPVNHGNSRYAHALPTVSGAVQPSAPQNVHHHPPPRLSTGHPPHASHQTSHPPPNMPPPAYTKNPPNKPGNKIPPRLPSMPPSAIYDGGSVMYQRGGSTATYGGYERPDLAPGAIQDFSNNVYEEVDSVILNPPTYSDAYTELGRQDSGYMDIHA